MGEREQQAQNVKRESQNVKRKKHTSQLPRVDVVVLYAIRRSYNLRLLQPRDTPHQIDLHVLGHRARDPVGVDQLRIVPLGLQPHDVRLFIPEPQDLRLQAGTVPRSLDRFPDVDATMQVVQHDLARQSRGVRLVAGHLVGHVWHRRVQEGEGIGRGVAKLFLEVGKVNRGFKEPRWSTGFETAECETC